MVTTCPVSVFTVFFCQLCESTHPLFSRGEQLFVFCKSFLKEKLPINKWIRLFRTQLLQFGMLWRLWLMWERDALEQRGQGLQHDRGGTPASSHLLLQFYSCRHTQVP
ncbi:hypothetical protein FQA47_008986 [Oryzias melastigma]|uniref:Uncharacterized protein n=1 Tax=Oryzias melastigma TaxID=30732 RepID=A0A834F0P8_ORYME|nr:hypothetical protein FQA47_008986 [Oryzias melastigma]